MSGHSPEPGEGPEVGSPQPAHDGEQPGPLHASALRLSACQNQKREGAGRGDLSSMLGPVAHISTLCTLLHELFWSDCVFWKEMADVPGGSSCSMVAAAPNCRQSAKVPDLV